MVPRDNLTEMDKLAISGVLMGAVATIASLLWRKGARERDAVRKILNDAKAETRMMREWENERKG